MLHIFHTKLMNPCFNRKRTRNIKAIELKPLEKVSFVISNIVITPPSSTKYLGNMLLKILLINFERKENVIIYVNIFQLNNLQYLNNLHYCICFVFLED